MAVFPNSVSEDFCIWMLATPWLEITNPQALIIAEVQAAAAASLSVTDNTWNNFLMTTWEHYKAYQSYIDQISAGLNEWIDYSATSIITGWSVFAAKQLRYTVQGKLLFVTFRLDGTSNATTVSFTLPFVFSNVQRLWELAIAVTNNGVAATGAGLCVGLQNTSTVNIYRTLAGAAWTAAGNKVVVGTMIIGI